MSRKQTLLLVNAALGTVALTCLVLHLAGYQLSLRGPPFVAVLPNESTVEKHGLRLTVTSVRFHGDRYRVNYAVEWIDPEDERGRQAINRPTCPMLVQFLDEAGNLVGVRVEAVTLGKDFVERRTFLCEAKCIVNSPARARFLSVGLGPPGLATENYPLPGR